MKIITKECGGGKTTELIKLSHYNKNYIVCHSQKECERVYAQSNELKYNIPFPITYYELLNGKYYSKGINGFLIDNIEFLLNYISRKVPVNAITITNKNESKPKTKLKCVLLKLSKKLENFCLS